ncbi:hypothetical protein [Actinomadura sp. SCN-SB]|uniref:hypothetical protein n=1 Tax=Actinomadura sp. SCN-SB TaxID=3373092 RepID=UPI003753E351
MPHTPLTADNSAVVLIDHEVGFSNLIGSHTIALATTAKLFNLPLMSPRPRGGSSLPRAVRQAEFQPGEVTGRDQDAQDDRDREAESLMQGVHRRERR